MTWARQSGFTIAELLVTMVVCSLVILAVTSLFITIEGSQRSSRLLETASRAGEQEIESLRNDDYNGLDAGETITFTNSLPDDLPTPRSGTVAVTEPVSGIKRVDVTITYKDGSNSKHIELSSLIGQIGIGQ